VNSRPPIALPAPDFSLVLGGPLYQLFRRAHLSGDALGGAVTIPFFYDIEAHVRFLVVLPILIAAELIVHKRLRPVIRQFIERRLVAPEDLPKFQQAIDSTLRVRNSLVGEVALLVLVYTVGIWVWRTQIALETATWYAVPQDEGTQLTPAGYWYLFVSLPIFQFILARWYLRFGLWFWFLWQVSRLELRLIPIHPDRTAGLSFLGRSTNAFVPILVAHGAMLAGLIASQIFYAGHDLAAFKLGIASFVAFLLVVMLSPLTVFGPQLWRAKRRGLGEFGRLAGRYVREFEEKWIHGNAPGGAAAGEAPQESLLGSADIQSLADLGNSYAVVQEMRFVPFGLKDAIRLAAATAAPLVPLTLTILSVEELADYAIKALF